MRGKTGANVPLHPRTAAPALLLLRGRLWGYTPCAMKREVDNCTGRVFDEIDALLQRLQRQCPKCDGELHREFSLLDRYTTFRLGKC